MSLVACGSRPQRYRQAKVFPFGGIAAIHSVTSRLCFSPMRPRRTTRLRAAGRSCAAKYSRGRSPILAHGTESVEHVIDDELVSRFVSDKRSMEILDWRLAFFASNAELRLPDNQAVRKRPSCGLVLGIDGEADRS